MKAIFDTKPGSGYDDEITRRYHFPARQNYMNVATAAIDDWIVYREPRRNGGRSAYIATAKVIAVVADSSRPDHAYAHVTDYLDFDAPIPFSGSGVHWEEPLRALGDPRRLGVSLQGKSMRPLADGDFAALIRAGLTQTLAPQNAVRLGLGVQDAEQALYVIDEPPDEQARRIEQTLINRKIRDANFRRQVCEAYDDRCAVTGLRIINGGGRSEVQAAHIWSVASGGPDVVQNGLALSGTAHWLFDRHLISLTDDHRLLVSHNKVPAELRTLFERQMDRIHLPKDRRLWPHPSYIARHREAYLAE